MKIRSKLANTTPAPIYSGTDITAVPMTVGSFDELAGVLPAFLANRVVMLSTDFSYRVYDATGENYDQGKIFLESDSELDMNGADLNNVGDVLIANDSQTKAISGKASVYQNLKFLQDGSFTIQSKNTVLIQIQNAPHFKVGTQTIDAYSKRLKNLADAQDEKDAVTKAQLEDVASESIDEEFKTCFYAERDDELSIDIRDPQKQNGYGNNGTCSYQGVATGVYMSPDAANAKVYFLHKAIHGYVGFLMIHEDLLAGFVDSTTQELPFDIYAVRAGFCKAFQSGIAEADANAIINCQGAYISKTDNANVIPPPNGYYVNGEPSQTHDFAQAQKATYTFGAVAPVDNSVVVRAKVFNESDTNAYLVPDASSPYFCIEVRAGGSVRGGGTGPPPLQLG